MLSPTGINLTLTGFKIGLSLVQIYDIYDEELQSFGHDASPFADGQGHKYIRVIIIICRVQHY